MKGIAIRTLFVIVVGIIGLGIIFAIITKILPSMHGQIDVVSRIFDVGDPNAPHKILEVGVYGWRKDLATKSCGFSVAAVRKFDFVDSSNHVLHWKKWKWATHGVDVFVKLNTKLKKDKCLLAKISDREKKLESGGVFTPEVYLSPPYVYLYWISPGSYSNPDSYSLFEHLSVNSSGCKKSYCRGDSCNCKELEDNGICFGQYNVFHHNNDVKCSEKIYIYKSDTEDKKIDSLRKLSFFDTNKTVKGHTMKVICKDPCAREMVSCCSQYGCCSLLQNDSSGYKFRLKYGIACGYSPGSDEAYWLACTEKNDGEVLLPDPDVSEEEGLECVYNYEKGVGYWVPKKIVGYITNNDLSYNYTLSLSDVGRYYDLEGLPIYKSVNNASLKSPEDKKLYLVFNTSSGKFAMFPSEDRIEPSSSLKNKITGFELREFEEPDVILLSLSGSEMDLKKVPECISVPGSFFNIKSIEVKGRYNVTLYSGPDCSGYSSTILGPINISDISTTSLTYLPQSMRITTYPSNLVRVFVTSGQYNFSSIRLANLISPNYYCNQAANSVGLGGSWISWISTLGVDAKDRIPDTTEGYYILNGTKVADNKADLTDGTIENPIDLPETLSQSPGPMTPYVWTATSNKGAYVPGLGRVAYGNLYSTTNWSYEGMADPANRYHIYCFENITGG